MSSVGAKGQEYPLVSIIFPNWNGKEDTLKCLRSITGLDYPKKQIAIIIADNGSSDGSIEAIREQFSKMRDFKRLKLIELGRNTGATGAYNAALLEAKTDYIFRLDNDVILEKNSLAELMKVITRYVEIGIVGSPIFLMNEDRLYSSGGRTKLWQAMLYNAGDPDRLKEVDRVSGCAMLFRKEVVNKIGFFDEDYFFYMDDPDWCFRAKKAGFKIVYVPTAKVWHKLSASVGTHTSPPVYYYTFRNRVLFMRKHASIHHWVTFPFFLWVFALLMSWRGICRGNWKGIIWIIKGVLWNVPFMRSRISPPGR